MQRKHAAIYEDQAKAISSMAKEQTKLESFMVSAKYDHKDVQQCRASDVWTSLVIVIALITL